MDNATIVQMMTPLMMTFHLQTVYHVSDLVNGSLSSAVPKQYETWPSVLEDFSFHSCMTYTPTKQSNLIA